MTLHAPPEVLGRRRRRTAAPAPAPVGTLRLEDGNALQLENEDAIALEVAA